ncbi:glycosyltransferase family 2 protein [Eubacterium ventriosum]|jgi:glycosyltransferase involved in cell wall biosynthesis|uniref:glycosyltransferase family 2 protein n=1 Tax=Eubacterium ventriosum TaxID=39496 RepID=UPI0035212BF4
MNSISIVIITRNEEDRIIECLDSIYPQLQSNDEIIIIDGASTDYTVSLIKDKDYLNCKVFCLEDYGYSLQRNVGIYKAKGDYILFISGDTIASKNLIKKYKKAINSNKYDILQGVVVNVTNNTLFGDYMSELYPILYKPIPKEFQEISTINLCVKRELLEENLFDENLISLEDKEWFYRIKRRYEDIKVTYLSTAVIKHNIHENLKQYGRKINKEAIVIGELYHRQRGKEEQKYMNYFGWIDITKLFVLEIFIFLTIALVLLINNCFWGIILEIVILAVVSIILINKIYCISKTKKNRFIICGLIVILLGYIITGIIKGVIKNENRSVCCTSR